MSDKTKKLLYSVASFLIFVLLCFIVDRYILTDEGADSDNVSPTQSAMQSDDENSVDVTKAPEVSEDSTPGATSETTKEATATATKEQVATSTPKPTKKPTPTNTPKPTKAPTNSDGRPSFNGDLKFTSYKSWESHFEKHGGEFDNYSNKEEYLAGANKVIKNPDSLYKTEKEDGDHIFYLEETNEFVVVSLEGKIRTYFRPSGGKKYYDRQ